MYGAGQLQVRGEEGKSPALGAMGSRNLLLQNCSLRFSLQVPATSLLMESLSLVLCLPIAIVTLRFSVAPLPHEWDQICFLRRPVLPFLLATED